MELNLSFYGRPLVLTLSQKALRELREQPSPLFVEMELCLKDFATKRVLCSAQPPIELEYQWVLGNLAIAYRPLLARLAAPDVSVEAKINQLEHKYPRWLWLDLDGQGYFGMFGLDKPEPAKSFKLPLLGPSKRRQIGL